MKHRRSQGPEERQLALLVLFLRSRGALTRAEIWAAVPGAWDGKEASARRKFERDKRALRELGVTLDFDALRGCYQLDRSRHALLPVQLTAGEGVLLRQAGALVVEDAASPFAPEVLGALTRFMAAAHRTSPLAEPPGDLVLHHPATDADPELPVKLSRAVLAARRRLPLRFTYRAPHHRGRTDRELHPWGVFAKRGRWFVVGECQHQGAERTFQLAHASGLEVVGLPDARPRFERPRELDLEALADRPPWRYPVHELCAVTLRAEAELADAIARALGGRAEGVEVIVEASNLPALFERLLDWSPRVSVQGPEEAVRAWREPLRELLVAHGEAP